MFLLFLLCGINWGFLCELTLINFCKCSMYRDLKYTLHLHILLFCLLHPYVLYISPWFIPSFLKSHKVADPLLSYFVMLLLRNLMPNWFISFVNDLVILLGGPEDFLFLKNLTRKKRTFINICLEVNHFGSVLLDFCPLIVWVYKFLNQASNTCLSVFNSG